MSVWVEAGVLTLTNTGAAATNSVGSMPGMPRAVRFFLVQATALDTFTAHERWCLGNLARAADDSVTQNSMAGANADTAATSDTGQRARNDCCLIIGTTPGATYTESGRCSGAFDANGFTLTNDAALLGAFRVGYVAYGGTDLTDADAGEFVNQNATGNQDVTGIFDGVSVVFLDDIGFSSAVPASSAGISQQTGIGIEGHSGVCVHWRDNNNVASWNTAMTQRTDKILYRTGTGTTIVGEATYAGAITGGFRLNHTVANGNRIFYMAIKGGEWSLGSLNSSTSVNGTGDFTYSGITTPKGALTMSWQLAASTAVDATNRRFAMGGYDGTDEWGGWGGTHEANEDSAVRISATKVCVHAEAGNTDTLSGEADASFTGGAFRTTWTDADTAAKQVLVLVTGEPATGVSLAAAPAADSTVSASLSLSLPLAAAPAGVSDVAAFLRLDLPLAAAPASVSDVLAALTVDTGAPLVDLAALVAGASDVAANPTMLYALAAAPASESSVASALGLALPLAAAPAGVSDIAADMRMSLSLSALSAGEATLVGALTVVQPVIQLLAAAVDAQSSVAMAAPAVAVRLWAVLDATSSVGAILRSETTIAGQNIGVPTFRVRGVRRRF